MASANSANQDFCIVLFTIQSNTITRHGCSKYDEKLDEISNHFTDLTLRLGNKKLPILNIQVIPINF